MIDLCSSTGYLLIATGAVLIAITSFIAGVFLTAAAAERVERRAVAAGLLHHAGKVYRLQKLD